MTASAARAAGELPASFTLDGRPVDIRAGESILEAADRIGIEIPRLCYKRGYRADGNCRACMVEIDGERVLAPACCRAPAPDMKVHTGSERALRSQRMVLELLLADMPGQGPSPHAIRSELDLWADKLGVSRPRFAGREQPATDRSNPAIAVNLDACIQCTRCVRACREEQVNDVIGYAFRGRHSAIVFDAGDPMGESSCVSCGECVQACPTGALAPAIPVEQMRTDTRIDSTCPYCGVGCLLTFNVKDGRITHVDGRDGPANLSRLCVKGRYGFDYIHHPARLTRPLIRREDAPAKSAALVKRPELARYFREASWQEALDFAASGLRRIRAEHGPRALAGFGSAKGSNEEAYLFQKLVRSAFGSNNVDHCTRLCHASSVAALLETIGSGAVSNPVEDVAEAEVIIVIGARPTVNHPVAATFMKNAAKAGKTLILMDPYRSDLARHARFHLQFNPDTDVPMLNALMHVIITEGLHNERFVAERTEGFADLKSTVLDYSPERVAPICGIPAQTLREVARLYARARGAMIFWGMGVSQHVHGTDNSRCLISLALLTGQIGRPGTGLHPLRGQNNVQGASDVGLIPMMLPDYLSVKDATARARFEQLWGTRLDADPGLTVVEVMNAVHAGKLKGMYIMGENPAMSDPNLNHAREALSMLDHLVVQEIFFTETAGYADVILPASAFPEKDGTFTNTDRRVQLGRKAVPPPGDARQDLWIIQELARRLDLDWHYAGARTVFEELRVAVPSMAGITWERLEHSGSVTYPCTSEGDPGEPILFKNAFPTTSGRGRFVPARYTRAAELPDQTFPYVFITGRQLEHWHTGAMTRHATVLNALEPLPVVSLNRADLEAIGAEPGDWLDIASRRGTVRAIARVDDGLLARTVFMPFCYHEAAANLLTNEELDPYGKIPEFKFCAVAVARANVAGAGA
ncbi:MAG: formate dehydrogenase subunit alpha [Gammaproteobacteria bacterium]|nr:formate dehydrogenase subunit alpha [Gammaproteobacteria bacterium]